MVDPENRLVADELASRWNLALARMQSLEQRLEIESRQSQPQVAADSASMLGLAEDLERVWNDPKVDTKTRKRLLRTLIQEIVVDVVEPHVLLLVVHWVGGVHSELRVTLRRRGQSGAHTEKDLIEVVRMLAKIGKDDFIAGILNKNGRTTGRGNRWSELRVRGMRSHNAIPPYSDEARLREGWMSLKHAAAHLKISASALRHAAERSEIPFQHPLARGPWIFRRADLDKPETRTIIEAIRRRGAVPDARQLSLEITTT